MFPGLTPSDCFGPGLKVRGSSITVGVWAKCGFWEWGEGAAQTQAAPAGFRAAGGDGGSISRGDRSQAALVPLRALGTSSPVCQRRWVEDGAALGTRRRWEISRTGRCLKPSQGRDGRCGTAPGSRSRGRSFERTNPAWVSGRTWS